MKTLAALLFSVVSLAGCATDPDREHPGMIDKDQNGAVDVTIGGEAGEWLEGQIGGDQRPVGGLGDHLDERMPEGIRAPRPVDDLSDALDIRGQGAIWPGRTIGALDDKIQGQVGAPRPTSGLDDKLEDRLGLSGGSRSIEELGLGEALTERLEQLISEQRHVDGALEDAAGEWAEEIILGERLYTLIHGPNGQHFLIDALGNPFVIRGSLTSGLPQR